MRALLKQYRLVIRFVIIFLVVYGLLTIAYNLYLNVSDGTKYYPDYATHLIAKQTEALLSGIGYSSEVLPHPKEPSMKIIIEGKYVARVIEGCNAISIMILFLSFIVAFAGEIKKTAIYCFAGSIIIYAFNLTRIVVLSVGLYHYPWRKEMLHNIVFPLLIYGTVFLLWMFWVNRFSKNLKQNA